jgi:hypothetical protein
MLGRMKKSHSKSRNEGHTKKLVDRMHNSHSLSYLNTNQNLRQLRKNHSKHRRNQGQSISDKEINTLLSLNLGFKDKSNSRKYSTIKRRKLRQNRQMSLINARDRKLRLCNDSEHGKKTISFSNLCILICFR